MAVELKNLALNDIMSDSHFICQMHIDNVMSSAFYGVSTLTAVEIYDASSIEANTFDGCANLSSLILPGIEDYSDVNLFGENKPPLEYVEIKEGTKNIGTTFSNLTNLTNIKLPASLETLDANALYGDPITTLSIARTTQLQSNALSGCDSLNTLMFNPALANSELHLYNANLN